MVTPVTPAPVSTETPKTGTPGPKSVGELLPGGKGVKKVAPKPVKKAVAPKAAEKPAPTKKATKKATPERAALKNGAITFDKSAEKAPAKKTPAPAKKAAPATAKPEPTKKEPGGIKWSAKRIATITALQSLGAVSPTTGVNAEVLAKQAKYTPNDAKHNCYKDQQLCQAGLVSRTTQEGSKVLAYFLTPAGQKLKTDSLK